MLFLCRKFPNVEEQSDSPSIRLLEKKKEAKVMQEAMEHKKEVRWGVGGVGWEMAVISVSLLTSFSDSVDLKLKAVLLESPLKVVKSALCPFLTGSCFRDT